MYDLGGLGERIRQLRMAKGLTQEAFAQLLDISPQAVSKWETGIGYPDITMLPAIAGIFDTTIDALLGLAPVEPTVPAEPMAPVNPVTPAAPIGPAAPAASAAAIRTSESGIHTMTREGRDISSLIIHARGSTTVRVRASSDGVWRMKASGRREFIDSLHCEEDGDTLRVYNDALNMSNFFGISLTKNVIDITTGFLSGEELEGQISGSGNFHVEPDFKKTEMKISGSGNMEMNHAGALKAQISGSGNIECKDARDANFRISGSGNVRAGALTGRNEMHISGSGDMSAQSVNGSLEASISGSGKITANSGTINDLKIKMSGAGSFDGRECTVGDLDVTISGGGGATIGRVTGRVDERVSRGARLRILQRG